MTTPTNVRLLLRGLLVVSAKEGQPNGKVGILRTAPAGHELKIAVHRIPPGPPPEPRILTRPDIRDRLYLNVTSAQPNITVRNNTPVNRLVAPVNQESVNWFVDLEKESELYTFPIGSNSSEFNPLLTFNSGQLFTAAISEDFLQVQRGIFSSYENFGYVAVQLGIDFLTAFKVVFKNGNQTIFDSATEPGIDYRIEISHDADVHPQGPVTDANNYYRALGTGIPLEQKILFMSIRPGIQAGGPPAGPEAACFPAYLGRTSI